MPGRKESPPDEAAGSAEGPKEEKSGVRATPGGGPIRKFLGLLGPGLVTGASDDDPSGIGTYAVAGASTGFATLWLAVVTVPMMVAIQFMCSNIGLVAGRGLAGVLRQHYPRALLYPIVLSLALANTINAGVDIGAVAAGANMLLPIPALWLVLDWVHLPVIATVARLLCREVTLQNEYLLLENRTFESKIPGRLRVTDEERRFLTEAALAMGRSLMREVVSTVKPETILAWQRRDPIARFCFCPSSRQHLL